MILPFSRTERFCREYYLNNGKVLPGVLSPDEIEPEESSVDERYRLFLNLVRSYHEEEMIPSGFDIGILTSPRYMPVFSHAHEFIEMIYVHTGRCTHIVRDDHEVLLEGEFCILPPGMPHRIECFHDDCVVLHIMARKTTFDSAFINLIRTRSALSHFFINSIYGSNQSVIRLDTKKDRKIREISWEMYRESLAGTDYSAAMLNVLFELLCLYIARDHLSHLIIKDDKDKKSGIPDVLEYVSKHYSTVNPQTLSDQFNYSEGHLRRLVRQTTGKSLKEIITEQRLIHAQILLDSTSLSIPEIAEQTGLGDVRTMQRLFKNKYGRSPSEYRQ